jgi:uncharacterized metal-binding protein
LQQATLDTTMPHVFTNRSRKYAIGVHEDKLTAHHTWETINVIAYEIGGLIFVVGSVLFLPKYSDYEAEGSWLFIVGSILYLIVTFHDGIELFFNKEATLALFVDSTAALTYVLGSITFIIGSVFFLPTVDKTVAGAWCFIWGSVLFILGAIMNAFQIYEASSVWTSRYMLLTALCYVIGSVFFALASVPYLWSFQSSEDETKIDDYLAAQYIIGSLLFFFGGCINGLHAHLVMKRDEQHLDEKLQQQQQQENSEATDENVEKAQQKQQQQQNTMEIIVDKTDDKGFDEEAKALRGGNY